MTGTTPEPAFSIPFIAAPASRRLDKLTPTPPPRLESCREEFNARPIDSILSWTSIKKQETISPRRFLPAFRKVGVAICRRCSICSSAICQAKSSSPSAKYKAVKAIRSSYLSKNRLLSLVFSAYCV